MPQHEVDQLVSYYLQQNGESERYHIICAIGVKTLDIDQALKNVAVSRLGRFNDVSTTFWRLEHQEEKL